MKKLEAGTNNFLYVINILLDKIEAFPNIPTAFWWAIATLTTVGYGDIYPVTAMGKFVSGIIAFLGIGIIALPTGLISVGFMDKVESAKPTTCPHCDKPIE